MLKVILRVEKAQAPSVEDAKPPLFGIVVQSPVLILSVRIFFSPSYRWSFHLTFELLPIVPV